MAYILDWIACLKQLKNEFAGKEEQNKACATHIRMPRYAHTCINVTVDKYVKNRQNYLIDVEQYSWYHDLKVKLDVYAMIKEKNNSII